MLGFLEYTLFNFLFVSIYTYLQKNKNFLSFKKKFKFLLLNHFTFVIVFLVV